MGVTNSVLCGIFKPSIADYKDLKGVPNVFLKIGPHVIEGHTVPLDYRLQVKLLGDRLSS